MFLLYLISHISLINTKLLFVFEHFRHGARGPWENVNISTGIDILNEKWNGIGELTGAGMRMHYLGGYADKKRYENFINLTKYNKNEFMIFSTLMNRTITSAYSHLIGMYSVNTGKKLNNEQKNFAKVPYWEYAGDIEQKINELNDYSIEEGLTLFPINVINPKDRLIRLDKKNVCPYSENVKQENTKIGKYNKTMDRFVKDFNDYYANPFMKVLNKNKDYFKVFKNIYYISDAFISTYFDDREMKNLKNENLNFEAFYKFALNVSFFYTFNLTFRGDDKDILAVVGMSPIFRKIIDWMDKRINLHKKQQSDLIKDDSPKMVFLSAHDSTLAAQSIFLNRIFNIPYNDTTFAASFQFELEYTNQNKYIVNYIINGVKMKEFNYDEFVTNIKKNIKSQEEINNFCDNKKKGINFWFIFMLVMIVLVIITIVLLILNPFGEKNPTTDNIYTLEG